MAKEKKSGCFVAFIGFLIVAGLGIIAAIVFMVNLRAKSAEERRANEPALIVFEDGHVPRFTMPEPGGIMTREAFVAFMIDEEATALAKETFRKVASESTVSWKLRTVDLEGGNGNPRGQFELPWEVQQKNRRFGGTLQVLCIFEEQGLMQLVNLRRGDWVTIEGQLGFDGDTAIIREARLADAPDPEERD